MRPTSLRFPIIAGLALALTLSLGCQRVAPTRTLPSWVRGVYIPMFKNHTYEPQIEETATRLTQEAFLADGRVDVVPKSQADLVLVVELGEWDTRTLRTRGDYIARTSEVLLTFSIKLYDPFDMTTPMADLGTLRITSGFNTDTRSNRYEPEPDRKAELLRRLADQVVINVLNGFPMELAKGAPGTAGASIMRTPETIPLDDTLRDRDGHDITTPRNPSMP